MAIFGGARDIDTFKIISKELLNDVISQQVGYYKFVLGESSTNIYGESLNKQFVGPILLTCLIERGEYETTNDDFGSDEKREVKFRFLRETLIEANLFPENGDIIMYNELYYEVDNTNDNQLILGKDKDYAYSEGLENFGEDYSVTLTTHWTRGDKLGITQQR